MCRRVRCHPLEVPIRLPSGLSFKDENTVLIHSTGMESLCLSVGSTIAVLLGAQELSTSK